MHKTKLLLHGNNCKSEECLRDWLVNLTQPFSMRKETTYSYMEELDLEIKLVILGKRFGLEMEVCVSSLFSLKIELGVAQGHCRIHGQRRRFAQ